MWQILLSRPAFSGTISLWDTAGMEKYRALAPIYYRNSSAAIAVYDIGNRPSFDHLSFWIRLYRAEDREENPVIIVGNKTDLEGRVVAAGEGKEAAAARGFVYVETSATDRTGIEELMDEIAVMLHNLPLKQGIGLRHAPRVKNVICC
jgi:Ras-related protein Rab-5C